MARSLLFPVLLAVASVLAALLGSTTVTVTITGPSGCCCGGGPGCPRQCNGVTIPGTLRLTITDLSGFAPNALGVPANGSVSVTLTFNALLCTWNGTVSMCSGPQSQSVGWTFTSGDPASASPIASLSYGCNANGNNPAIPLAILSCAPYDAVNSNPFQTVGGVGQATSCWCNGPIPTRVRVEVTQ